MKYSNRDLIKRIKEQETQIDVLGKRLTEVNEEKTKYWGMYQKQLKKTMELSIEGNKDACEFYLSCEIANSMCLTANGLNAECKFRDTIRDEINKRVKEAVHG